MTYYNLILITLVSAACIYLVFNMWLQVRGKKMIVNSLTAHRNHELKEIKKIIVKLNQKDHQVLSDEELSALLDTVKKEISEIKDARYKSIMSKTFDRKDINNQKQYALQIMEDCNFSNSVLSF